MNRRELLGSAAVVVSGLAGCTALQSDGDRADGDDGESPSESTTTATPSTADSPTATKSPDSPPKSTSTATPEPFPYSCPEAPDIEGLPSLPASQTEDSIRKFVVEFERAYAVATNDEYAGIADVQVNSVDSLDGRFQVKLAVEAEVQTSTPGPDGETPTPTPRPADASAHRALYRIQGEQVVRELRDFPGGRKLDSECWTVETGE